MIEKMTKYSFVLLDAGKEDFLSRLQEEIHRFTAA